MDLNFRGHKRMRILIFAYNKFCEFQVFWKIREIKCAPTVTFYIFMK